MSGGLRDTSNVPVQPQAAVLQAQRARLALFQALGTPHALCTLHGLALLAPARELCTASARRIIACHWYRAEVQVHSTHHRTLFPRIVSTRETYLLTSHAKSPLCVWDLR